VKQSTADFPVCVCARQKRRLESLRYSGRLPPQLVVHQQKQTLTSAPVVFSPLLKNLRNFAGWAVICSCRGRDLSQRIQISGTSDVVGFLFRFLTSPSRVRFRTPISQ
jgi:hypothetical protein